MNLLQRRSKARLLVVLSDLHCGHRLGLLAPGTELLEIDEKGRATAWVPSLGPVQQYLWELYEGQIRDIMGRGQDVRVAAARHSSEPVAAATSTFTKI